MSTRPLTLAWRWRATMAALTLAPLVHLVSLQRLTGWSTGRGSSRPEDHSVDDVALAEWVDRVLGWLPWPWRRTCLKRAIAIHALLARAGRPAALQVGVRREPSGELAAHAWLTRKGLPVLEPNPSELARLEVITSFGTEPSA